MEHVKGRTVSHKVLSKMSVQESEHLALQLKVYVDELRALGSRSSPGHIKFGRRPNGEYTSEARFPDPIPDTEYETIEQFIQYWKNIATHLGMGPNEAAISQVPNIIYRATTMPVLSHGDLKPENEIINEDGNIAAIIDRETFGWYPDFWDPWCYV